jgi:retinol dehydrogenase-12
MGFFASLLYSQLFVSLPIPAQSFASQTIIITGSNTGLGLEATKHFVRLHATHVILAVRTPWKGEAAKKVIREQYPPEEFNTKIDVWALDLSSFASVKEFVEKVERLDRLDVLLENAGIMTNYWKQYEGMESTIQTNVLGTEFLALLCLPKMQETSAKWNTLPRLCIVTSDLHTVVKFEEGRESDVFQALNREESWGHAMGDRLVSNPLNLGRIETCY